MINLNNDRELLGKITAFIYGGEHTITSDSKETSKRDVCDKTFVIDAIFSKANKSDVMFLYTTEKKWCLTYHRANDHYYAVHGCEEACEADIILLRLAM